VRAERVKKMTVEGKDTSGARLRQQVANGTVK